MGYYDVLDEIIRLNKNNISRVTMKDIYNNLDVSERAIRRSLNALVNDGKISRVLVFSHGGATCYYSLAKFKGSEGFINDVFKVIVRIIR